MSELKKLREIQQLELKKAELEKQLKHLPAARELKKLKAEIEAGQELLKQKKEAYDREKKNLKNKEAEAAGEREKYETLSKELYSGQSGSAKELAGAAAKLDELKEKIGLLDDEIIDLMEKVEEERQVILAETAALNIKKDSFRQLHREYQAQKDDFSAEIDRIPSLKDALAKEVTAGIMAIYQKHKADFPDGVVIADMQNGICSGCHMGVSFDIMKHLKSDGKIIYCDHCGRILLPVD